MSLTVSTCLRVVGLGAVLIGSAGCSSAPPGAFARAQSATAARVAAGIPAPAPVEIAATPRRPARTRAIAAAPHRPLVVATRAAPSSRAEDDARTEARERQMRKVMRGICPTCLGPEPVFALDDRARRAVTGGDHENTGKAAPRSPPPQSERAAARSADIP